MGEYSQEITDGAYSVYSLLKGQHPSLIQTKQDRAYTLALSRTIQGRLYLCFCLFFKGASDEDNTSEHQRQAAHPKLPPLNLPETQKGGNYRFI